MADNDYGIEYRAEKLRDEAMADLDNLNIESAIDKFIEATKISGEGIPLENLGIIVQKSLDENKLDELIMQLALGGQNPIQYLKDTLENPIKYLADCKKYAWEQKYKDTVKNGEARAWNKRYEIAKKILRDWK